MYTAPTWANHSISVWSPFVKSRGARRRSDHRSLHPKIAQRIKEIGSFCRSGWDSRRCPLNSILGMPVRRYYANELCRDVLPQVQSLTENFMKLTESRSTVTTVSTPRDLPMERNLNLRQWFWTRPKGTLGAVFALHQRPSAISCTQFTCGKSPAFHPGYL